MEEIFKEVESKMGKTTEILAKELLRIRTGRANSALVEDIKVNYYGTKLPLKQIASISVPTPQTLVIQPWDKNMAVEIEKSIHKANLGVTPDIKGSVIRINLPPLSGERREELIKLVSKLTEGSKVAIRNIRRDGIEKLKKLEKEKKISEDEFYRGQERIQELTDKYTKKISEMLEKKKKEILEE